MTARAEQKRFAASDETREFERGTLELLRIGGAEIGRLTLQPGWRWSEHVKPLAGTDLCEAPHFQYHVQGILHVVMADGSEFDARPETSPRSPRATTPGWWATSRSWWSTGMAPATTPGAELSGRRRRWRDGRGYSFPRFLDPRMIWVTV